MELGSNCLFKNFGNEGSIGDRRGVVEVGGVGARFFQNWGNGSSFERCRDNSSGERGVDDGKDEGYQRGEAGFN